MFTLTDLVIRLSQHQDGKSVKNVQIVLAIDGRQVVTDVQGVFEVKEMPGVVLIQGTSVRL